MSNQAVEECCDGNSEADPEALVRDVIVVGVVANGGPEEGSPAAFGARRRVGKAEGLHGVRREIDGSAGGLKGKGTENVTVIHLERAPVIMLPVSIVLPASNRPSILELILPGYLRQGCAELIVVDDASDPPLREVQATDSDTVVRWIRLDQKANAPGARMAGVRAASQPWIFFGEDDAFLTDGCVASLFQHVKSGVCDIAAPQLITIKHIPQNLTGCPAPDRFVRQTEEVLDARAMQMDYRYQPAVPIPVPWLHALSLVSRDTVLRVGFDVRFRGNAYREETDFYVRAWDEGQRLAMVPAPPALHYKGRLNASRLREASRLLWTEYWVLRNNYYFLEKNQGALRKAGAASRPLRDTVALAGIRVRWYWRRLMILLFDRSSEHTAIPL